MNDQEHGMTVAAGAADNRLTGGEGARGLERLGLRLRVFLFFALIAAGSAAIVAGAAAFGHARLAVLDPASAFAATAAIAIFLILGLVTAVWLLFDEHVARPLLALAADLRAKAHAGAPTRIDGRSARYLGDLAPAVTAVASNLERTRTAVDEAVARETERLAAENARLAAILERAPVGVVACSAERRIALYNGRALALLGGSTVVGLGRPLPPVLDAGGGAGGTAPGRAAGVRMGAAPLPAPRTGRAGAGEEGLVLFLEPDGEAETGPEAGAERRQRPVAARPGGEGALLLYDFSVLAAAPAPDPNAVPLDALPMVVFDTETTGLYPERGDEIVQIGAVRMLNGRVLAAEVFDTLVDPGRPIPATSARIHGITSERVAGAPTIAEAGRAFLAFSEGAVLVAHNAPFDLACFERHAGAIGTRIRQPVLDTILLSAVLFGEAASLGLDELAERLGVPIDGAARHTALGDAVATARILERLVPMLKERGVVTLADALAASRRHRGVR